MQAITVSDMPAFQTPQCKACGTQTTNPNRLCSDCAPDYDRSRELTVHAAAVDRVHAK